MFDKRTNLSSFVFEITQKCNHNCLYCYNVWKCPNIKYPDGKELSTEQIKKIILKLKEETKIKYLAISGGEPLLREDTPEIIKFCSDNFTEANLLTNGSLLTEETCKKCVEANTSIFEIPFLAIDQKIHYKLTRKNDLREVIQGIKNLKKYETKLVTVFVATKINIKQIKEIVETAIALGVDGIMFNRFNPGGEGLRYIAELMPSLNEIKEALKILNDLVRYYGIKASASIPIQKCLINPREFRHINFGYCPSGNEKSYFTIDAYGNVRICNHSPTILGNLLKQDFKEITENEFVKEFQESFPGHCKECKEVRSCWGGCKASAQVCNGSLSKLDPFLERNFNKK